MTGQDGGFRAASARFSAEVAAALTRARRAASEAKAQSAEFRKKTSELAEQAKTGRLRGVHRDQVEPTGEAARADAAKFRNDNGLPVEDLPAADALIGRLPEPEPVPDDDDLDEDFSQHAVMVDVDERAAPAEPVPPVQDPPDDRPDEGSRDVSRTRETVGSDSTVPPNTPPNVGTVPDDEDFSQQRILFDVSGETYRPSAFPDSVLGLSDEQNPS